MIILASRVPRVFKQKALLALDSSFFESISKYSIFQAEIVRKKGKNLLSDPIFNKVKPGFKI